MAFFDELTKTITSVGKDAADKAMNLKDIAKMRIELKSKEDFIERQYIEIGKKVYEAEKDAETSAFEEVFAINQTLEEIESLKSEILTARGYKKCASCGADINPDVKFCPSCGAPVETVEDDEEPEYEEDSEE